MVTGHRSPVRPDVERVKTASLRYSMSLVREADGGKASTPDGQGKLRARSRLRCFADSDEGTDGDNLKTVEQSDEETTTSTYGNIGSEQEHECSVGDRSEMAECRRLP